jgi:hypothetical protein
MEGRLAMYPSVLITYVQLGDNPSPTLEHYAGLNSMAILNSKNVLITDKPTKYENFPGEIILYRGEPELPGFRKYLNHNRAYSNIAGGYWRFTMERLFALNVLKEIYPNEYPVLHVESDVLLLLNGSILEKMKNVFLKTSIPRYSTSDGIASVLFAPSVGQLSRDLLKLDAILGDNLDSSSDMALLGLGLREGVLGELPSHPRNALVVQSERDEQTRYIVFDGLAYGQYLFGQDPVHTGNRVISGYQNPCFDLDLSQVNWEITKSIETCTPMFIWEDKAIDVVNIHMHSKILIEPTKNNFWEHVLDEANGKVDRTVGPFVQDMIHTIKSSPLDRLRIVRRRGFVNSIKRGLRHRASKLFPK